MKRHCLKVVASALCATLIYPTTDARAQIDPHVAGLAAVTLAAAGSALVYQACKIFLKPAESLPRLQSEKTDTSSVDAMVKNLTVVTSMLSEQVEQSPPTDQSQIALRLVADTSVLNFEAITQLSSEEFGRQVKRVGLALGGNVGLAHAQNLMTLRQLSPQSFLNAISSGSGARLQGTQWPVRIKPIDLEEGSFSGSHQLAVYVDFVQMANANLNNENELQDKDSLFVAFTQSHPAPFSQFDSVTYLELEQIKTAIKNARARIKRAKLQGEFVIEDHTISNFQRSRFATGSTYDVVLRIKGATNNRDYIRANQILLLTVAGMVKEKSEFGYQSKEQLRAFDRKMENIEKTMPVGRFPIL